MNKKLRDVTTKELRDELALRDKFNSVSMILAAETASDVVCKIYFDFDTVVIHVYDEVYHITGENLKTLANTIPLIS
jgi:hypothetical protein